MGGRARVRKHGLRLLTLWPGNHACLASGREVCGPGKGDSNRPGCILHQMLPGMGGRVGVGWGWGCVGGCLGTGGRGAACAAPTPRHPAAPRPCFAGPRAGTALRCQLTTQVPVALQWPGSVLPSAPAVRPVHLAPSRITQSSPWQSLQSRWPGQLASTQTACGPSGSGSGHG